MTTSSRRIVRAAVIALALGAGTVATTLPVQAQGFGFSFGFGNNRGDDGFSQLCVTDRQLRQAIRNQGYSDVALNVEMNNRIKARATRGDWVYQLVVNACTGRILDRERLRRS